MSEEVRTPIGVAMPRPATRRLVEGRGRYVDDLNLPRMLHAAFLRSPHARAAITRLEAAASEPPAYPELAGNVGRRLAIETSGFAEAFAAAAFVVSDRITFSRHTGVPLEPRGIISEYDHGEGVLTLHHSHQVPHQIQQHFSDLLGLGAHRVRVICPDVGGGFGIKLHLYPDETAIAAAALLVKRPIKWIADRSLAPAPRHARPCARQAVVVDRL